MISKILCTILLIGSSSCGVAFVPRNNRVAPWSTRTSKSPATTTPAFRHDNSNVLKITNLHSLESSLSMESSLISPDLNSGPCEVSSEINDDPIATVRKLTERAIWNPGCPSGIEALEQLSFMCAQRQPYQFNDDGDRSSSPQTSNSIVSPQRQILPPHVTQGILQQAKEMQENGWLSTNPDSVDNLPSFHLNLVSGGKPIFDNSASSSTLGEFEQGLSNMLDLVHPHIYNELLPHVQQLMGSNSKIKVSDVFIRRYGLDEVSGEARHGISAHFDVFSQVTTVIALDDVASEGTSGLYTTAYSNNNNDGSTDNNMMAQNGITSNHAALRRYFPLNSGDGVVHTWDVLHGVDILPGMDRTSLIVWFDSDENEEATTGKSQTCSPWLSDHPDLDTDDIAQFVYASSMESSTPYPSNLEHEQDSDEDKKRVEVPRSTIESVMNLIDDDTHSNIHMCSESTDSDPPKQEQQHPHDFYLKSASLGNAFALSRLGSLCEDQALSPQRVTRAMGLLEKLHPKDASNELPSFFQPKQYHNDNCNDVDWRYMARRFWLEGSRRGNPKSQLALGDEIMEQAVLQQSSDLRLLAAVFFGLATQQNQESAQDLLSSVIDFEMSSGSILSEEDFHSSPIVQTAQAATIAL